MLLSCVLEVPVALVMTCLFACYELGPIVFLQRYTLPGASLELKGALDYARVFTDGWAPREESCKGLEENNNNISVS